MWQASFKQRKHQIRHEARAQKVHRAGTGGGPVSTIKLSDVKERALNAWGRVVVDGLNMGEVSRGVPVPVTAYEDVDEVATMSVLPASSPPSPLPSLAPPTPNASTFASAAPRKTSKRRQLDAMIAIDTKIADAISHMADSVGKLADNVGKLAENTANNTSRMTEYYDRMLANQDRMLEMLMQKNK